MPLAGPGGRADSGRSDPDRRRSRAPDDPILPHVRVRCEWGRAVTSSASPSLESVSPQAICGSAAAIWVAAAQAMLDSPVLAEDIDIEPQRLAQAACRHHAAHAAELDGLQAHPARGVALVVAANVVERMDALVGPDRDPARRGRHVSHARDVVRMHGLLEEIEPGIGDRAHILPRFVGAPALVGVSRDQRVRLENFADRAGCARRRPAACRCRP